MPKAGKPVAARRMHMLMCIATILHEVHSLYIHRHKRLTGVLLYSMFMHLPLSNICVDL